MENTKLRCAVVQPMRGLPSNVIDKTYADAAKLLESLGYEPVFLGVPSSRRKGVTNPALYRVSEMIRLLSTCHVMFIAGDHDIDDMTAIMKMIGNYSGMGTYFRHELVRPDSGCGCSCGRGHDGSMPSSETIAECVEKVSKMMM